MMSRTVIWSHANFCELDFSGFPMDRDYDGWRKPDSDYGRDWWHDHAANYSALHNATTRFCHHSFHMSATRSFSWIKVLSLQSADYVSSSSSETFDWWVRFMGFPDRHSRQRVKLCQNYNKARWAYLACERLRADIDRRFHGQLFHASGVAVFRIVAINCSRCLRFANCTCS